ncbi:Divalent-cation tolerance protein CutA [Pirellulimonas nuda]|uniref:Divalent-cation tolerance protein CutA n=1 Tax=Pirellulimonas nuda TaxID=2528009 RepID=A0A518DJL9_9BACT|nr:divalent-cation tolerance protein CutA [Pirellulimonas nuda]QDU91681.1 Divalent-cation tolerance protein CutA [Pirellulimonas nuda]
MNDYWLITTTTGDHAVAERIAVQLVEQRLAACVQVSGPIRSTYHWQGAIETGEEWLVTAKSRSDLFSRVEQTIVGLHPYDVPEVVATPLTAVGAAYGAWLAASLK